MNSFLSSLCVVVAAHLLFSGSYDASEVYHDACDFTDFNRYSLNASSGSSCSILRDLPKFIVLYKDRPANICVLATIECMDGIPIWNGMRFYHDRSIGIDIFEENVSVKISYHLKPEDVSLDENGTTFQYQLTTNDGDSSALSSVSVLLVYGPPGNPRNIIVNINCTTANISWTPSPRARYYVVTIKCGDTFVASNETVYNNNYQFNFTYDRNKCKLSLYAVNPSGPSDRAMKKSITKRYEDPVYALVDYGVNITDESAHLYFNVTVGKECPFPRPHHFNVCVEGNECVNVTYQEFNLWLYKEVIQLQLLLHRHLRATIGVCTFTKCIMLSLDALPLSTYHIKQAGRCHDNGTCFLRCEFSKHFQGNGCVYTFTSEQERLKKTVYLKIGDTVQHSLKDNGIYHVSVYDWEDGFQWDTIPPAISYFIEVKKAPAQINDNIIAVIAGASSGVVAVFIILITIILVVIGIVWYLNKRTGRQDINGASAGSRTRSNLNDTVMTVLSERDEKLDDSDAKTASSTTVTMNLDPPMMSTNNLPTVPKHTVETEGRNAETESASESASEPVIPTDPIPGSMDPIPEPKNPIPVPKDLDIVDTKDTELFLDSKEDNDSRRADAIDKEKFVDPVPTAVAAKNIGALEIDKGSWKPVAEDQSGAGATTESGTTSVQDSDEFLLDKHRCNTSSTKRGSCHTGNRIVGKIVTYSSQLRSRLTNTTHEETGESVTKSASKTHAVVGSNEPAAYSFGPNVLPKEGQVGEYSPVSPSEEQTLDTSASMIKEVVSGRASTSLKVAV